MQIIRLAVREGDVDDQVDPADPRRAGVQGPRGLPQLPVGIALGCRGAMITQLSS